MRFKLQRGIHIFHKFTFLFLLTQPLHAQNIRAREKKQIIIEWVLPANIKDELLNNASAEKFTLNYTTLENFSIITDKNSIEGKVVNGRIKWIIYSDQPVSVNIDWMPGTKGICSPGDSIHIYSKNNKYQYAGTGAQKFELFYKLHLALQTVKKPNSIKYEFAIGSADDYFAWNSYIDKCLQLLLSIIDSFQNKLSVFEFNYIKCVYIEAYELDRVIAYTVLTEKANIFGLNSNDLSAIADTTLFKPYVVLLHRNANNYYGNGVYFELTDRINLLKSLNFEQNKAILGNWALKYYRFKQNYSGTLRERLLQSIVYKHTTRSPLRTRQATAILSDYYSDTSYPEYKEWVRDWQFEHWKKNLVSSQGPSNFTLKDECGKTLTKNDLKNKLALLYFWKSNSTECKEAGAALQVIYEKYKNDTNIVFICVSADTDRNQWFESIMEKKYTIAGGTHFFAGADDVNLSVIEYFSGFQFPGVILINANGVVVDYPLDISTSDEVAKTIGLVEKYRNELLIHQHDGPYVMHRNDSLDIYYINSPGSYQLVRSPKKSTLPFTVQTDEFQSWFSVSLQKELNIEPSVFKKPSRQLVISDIEGNFASFKKLLTASGVINENYSWTFGNGHLVLVGDFFDRGKQVTECLWLIYSLEEKAKKAGGYVHFILGNHEIMNMSSDTFYTDEKYTKTARLLNIEYIDLYNKNTELGRWLRTKNIIEKIGKILYVHGGVSPSVNRLGLSIQSINDLARPYYDSKTDSSNQTLLTLYNSRKTRTEISRTSPFWFRGYYENSEHAREIPSMAQVDSSLSQFKVSRIITGHTIIGSGDKITSHYDDKIINIDTKHAQGKGKALLIVEDVYYQIGLNGEKILLFNKQETNLANTNPIKSTSQNK
jgi:hypothetical protein